MIIITKDRVGHMHYDIMRRCYNKNSVMYRDYGAKGITVCDEWHDKKAFVNWAFQNGYSKEMRLKRIDTTKGYSPENCKFVTCNTKNHGAGQKMKSNKELHRKMKEMYGIPENFSRLRIYRIYAKMLNRCYKKTSSHYINYGARGIRVCDEWRGKFGFYVFYRWSMDNGYTDNLTIDRIDNNGDYSPSNCRWTDWLTQARNRRNTIRFDFNGQNLTAAEIKEITGEKRDAVIKKYKRV